MDGDGIVSPDEVVADEFGGELCSTGFDGVNQTIADLNALGADIIDVSVLEDLSAAETEETADLLKLGNKASEKLSSDESSDDTKGFQFGVLGIGVAGMAEAFGVGVSGSVLSAFDDDGGTAIMYTVGYKGGPVPAASGGINLLWADVDRVYDLEGNSVGGGGSADIGISVGADVNTFLSEGENKIVADVSVGLGLSLLAGEGHANLDHTGFLWESENNK